jgi:phosphohistidine phosphatase
MDIYLIRHAEAVDIDNDIVEDGFRYITPAGRKNAISVASKLKEMKVHFDCIISSPLVRAVQTAEVFSAVLNHKPEIKAAIELIGGYSNHRFIQLLRKNSHHKSIACFGHSPDVNLFAIALLKNNNVKELKLNFKNCSVCKIHYDLHSEKGEFKFFLKSDTMEVVSS